MIVEDGVNGRSEEVKFKSEESYWAISSSCCSFVQNMMNCGFSVPAVPSKLLIFFLLASSLWLRD
jgi:hypothetical protein